MPKEIVHKFQRNEEFLLYNSFNWSDKIIFWNNKYNENFRRIDEIHVSEENSVVHIEGLYEQDLYYEEDIYNDKDY